MFAFKIDSDDGRIKESREGMVNTAHIVNACANLCTTWMIIMQSFQKSLSQPENSSGGISSSRG